MSVTRINRFTAADGMTDRLRDFLKSIIPAIEQTPGCEGCRLLQNRENPKEFIVLELWGSLEAHQASAGQVPPQLISRVMTLLAAPPDGDYYLPLAG